MQLVLDGVFGNQYRPNEKVLAKWTDLRWYPATVVKKMDNGETILFFILMMIMNELLTIVFTS